MKNAAHFGCLLLASISLLFWCSPVHAQLPKGLEQCLPYPTLAQELKDMRDDTQKLSTDAEEAPAVQIRIVSIAFAAGAEFSHSLREDLTKQIRDAKLYDDPQLDWLEELQEVGIRGHLQDMGYFRAEVAAAARRVTTEDNAHDYSLTLYIEPGPQYRLGKVLFASPDPDRSLTFSPAELGNLLAIPRGNLFRAREIRAAMESITKFYGSRGFIDCVPAPDTMIDENAKTIDVTLRIDEGRQYRVGKVEILGMSDDFKSKLKFAPQPGQVFNTSQMQKFLRRNGALPPSLANPRVEISRNTKAGIVDLRFDFWSYPSCAGLAIAQIPEPPHR